MQQNNQLHARIHPTRYELPSKRIGRELKKDTRITKNKYQSSRHFLLQLSHIQGITTTRTAHVTGVGQIAVKNNIRTF